MRLCSLEEHLKKLNIDEIKAVASLWHINMDELFSSGAYCPSYSSTPHIKSPHITSRNSTRLSTPSARLTYLTHHTRITHTTRTNRFTDAEPTENADVDENFGFAEDAGGNAEGAEGAEDAEGAENTENTKEARNAGNARDNTDSEDEHTRKQRIIQELIKRICDKDRIKSVINSLSEREQQIIGIFALNNWVISRNELRLWDITEDELGVSPLTARTASHTSHTSHIYPIPNSHTPLTPHALHTPHEEASEPPVSSPSLSSHNSHSQHSNPASPASSHSTHSARSAQHGLRCRGLLGMLLLVKSRKYNSLVYVVPEELRDGIKSAFSSEANAEIQDASRIQKLKKEKNILDDILIFLSYANVGIPLTPSLRRIRKRYAERIMEELSESSQKYLMFIRRTCEMLDIVRQHTQNRKILLKTTDKAKEFMHKRKEERVLEILHAFSRNYDGVKRIVLSELGKLKPDVWYDLKLFEQNVRNAVFKDRKYWFYFNKSAVRRVIKHLVMLGLADVGFYASENVSENASGIALENASEIALKSESASGGGSGFRGVSSECSEWSEWNAFRLKSAFFGVYGSARSARRNEKTLIVQPNFEVIAFPETSDEVIFSLTRFASVKRADKVTTFVVSKESVMRAMECGMSEEEILRVLCEHARNEIPQNVIFTIKSWCSSFGKVVFKQCVFLKTAPELMDALKKWINITEISEGCGICDKNEFKEVLSHHDVLAIEVEDDVTAAVVERVLRESGVDARRHSNIFLISQKDVGVCVNELRKRGLFPKILLDNK